MKWGRRLPVAGQLTMPPDGRLSPRFATLFVRRHQRYLHQHCLHVISSTTACVVPFRQFFFDFVWFTFRSSPPIVVGIEVVCLLLLLLTHLRARFKCDRQPRAASILKFEFCFVLCREDEDAGHVTTSRRSSPTTQSPSSLTTPLAFSRYLSRWLRVCREMEYF